MIYIIKRYLIAFFLASFFIYPSNTFASTSTQTVASNISAESLWGTSSTVVPIEVTTMSKEEAMFAIFRVFSLFIFLASLVYLIYHSIFLIYCLLFKKNITKTIKNFRRGLLLTIIAFVILLVIVYFTSFTYWSPEYTA